jgi:putative ABC transport system substrate-binding protein
MNRRMVIAGAITLVVAPLPVAAQQARLPRIGVLLIVDLERTQAQLREELRQLGYVEGQNVTIEFRLVPAGQSELLPDLARELVGLKVDVIVAQFTAAAQAAKAATTTIPIVMAAVGDPVETGLVASLARPGGNVTGSAALAGELAGKSVQLIKELLPARRIAVMASSTNPFTRPFLDQIQLAAGHLGVDVQQIMLDSAEGLDAAFAQVSNTRIDAVIVQPALAARGAARLALEHRVPALSVPRWFAEQGGLMSYGPIFADLYHQSAIYVDKILRGAKPADLPVVQATKFELVINAKTAKTLGITIPPSLMLRANEVIE